MPDPDVEIDEWSNEYRYLPPDSSEPGKFRLSRTPYMRDIMRDLSPKSPIEEVVLVKGGQIAGSETANNFIGYIMHIAPGRTMMVQPTVDAAKDYVRERINPLIEYTPAIKQRCSEGKSRDGSNTVKFKRFPGGFLAVTGANSAQALQSRAIRYLILDEIDRYPRDVDGQGDPLGMAVKRTDTFKRNRKIFKLSTPGNKDESRILVDYAETDKRRYFVPCPHCGNMDYIQWSNIHWPPGHPEKAALTCTACGAEIEEHHKTWFMDPARAEWRPTAISKRPRSRGYHLPGLYSPLGWRSWGDIATDWEQAMDLAARGDDTLLKKITTMDLGEGYEQQGERARVSTIKARAETYQHRMVPYGGLIVTAAVDVQHNRLECKIMAWGRAEEAWVIDYHIIWGDTLQSQVWADLETWLQTPLRYQNGVEMRIAACAIDAGDGTTSEEVYKFVRWKSHRLIFAIKGAKSFDAPVLPPPTAREVDRQGKRVKTGDLLWVIGVSQIKVIIAARLRLETPGKNYIHFPTWLPDEYWPHLGSESLKKRYINGNAYQRWEKIPGARNEGWDLLVYNYAAACRIGINRWGEAQWQECERHLSQHDLLSGIETPQHEQPEIISNEAAPGGQTEELETAAGDDVNQSPPRFTPPVKIAINPPAPQARRIGRSTYLR
ncbi:MAG: phage terminase large subunit family protein [Sulfuricella sp.]|nr:phage terminase large subunit family protein [Sulfuricella sp.]